LIYYRENPGKKQVPVEREKVGAGGGRAEQAGGREGLFTAHIRTPSATFYVGGGLLECKRSRIAGAGCKNAEKRGRVTMFTRQSRRRMQKKINMIDRTATPLPLFVTLTFPDELDDLAGDEQGKVVLAKKYFRRFEKRFVRKFDSGALIWRIDWKMRSSGRFVGKWFPHYHMFVFGVTQADLRKWLDEAWWDVCGRLSVAHLKAGCNVKQMWSWQGASSYISKYLAKDAGHDVPIFECGRLWGVIGYERIPWAEDILVKLTEDQAKKLIRYMRRYARLRGRCFRSLSIFCDPGFWYARLYDLIGETVIEHRPRSTDRNTGGGSAAEKGW
jgi:hypothetical protein